MDFARRQHSATIAHLDSREKDWDMSVVRVKICGITRVEDASAAGAAGADAIGMVFYAKSRRHVKDLVLAREIALAAGPFVTVTALFVDAEPAFVEQVLAQVPINLLQFHGSETPQYCDHFKLPYIKALRVRETDSGGEIIAAQAGIYASASGILLDTYVRGVPGGTGETFNWQSVPKALELPVIVAGGLTPDNVAKAIRATKAYAVDVSGGVESSPGIKDHRKISKFISNAKALEKTNSED